MWRIKRGFFPLHFQPGTVSTRKVFPRAEETQRPDKVCAVVFTRNGWCRSWRRGRIGKCENLIRRGNENQSNFDICRRRVALEIFGVKFEDKLSASTDDVNFDSRKSKRERERDQISPRYKWEFFHFLSFRVAAAEEMTSEITFFSPSLKRGRKKRKSQFYNRVKKVFYSLLLLSSSRCASAKKTTFVDFFKPNPAASGSFLHNPDIMNRWYLSLSRESKG